MSTPFYDLASLVVVPSGYKASKVYAQKPLTTDGQLTFSRASTATRVNSAGLIETVSSNVPRLDYQGSTCPKLLLEPSRTNSLIRSSEFDNAAWVLNNITVTANAAVSPDGTTNADTITITSTSTPSVYQTLTVSASTSYVFTSYVKAGTLTSVNLAAYDLSNNAFIFSGETKAITSDWTRITHVFTTPAGCTSIRMFPVRSSAATGTFYLWGAQLEAGAYATSYIPTTTAAVTRLAETAVKTGISSLIGSTEGVLYAEVDIKLLQQAGRILLDVNDGDTTNRVLLALNGSAVEGFVQGSPRVAYTLPSAGVYKFAFAYKSGDFALYVNGVQRSTSTDAITFSGMNLLFLGHTFYISNTQPVDGIKSALLFKTRLPNAQLAELTSL